MRSMLVALVLLAFAAWSLRPRDVSAEPAPPPVVRPDPIQPLGAGLVPPPLVVRERPKSAPPAAPAPPEDLIASLRRLGEIYVASVEASNAGAMPAGLETELKERLEAILNDAATVGRVLGMLQSNELARRDADGATLEKLTLEETGAFWTAFWGFGAYNDASGLDVSSAAVDGARFASDVFVALTWTRPEVGRQLARHLLRMTLADGTFVLDRRFLPELLTLARSNPECAALRELLLGLSERLSEAERWEILRFYLPQDDPDRLIAEIKDLLTSGSTQRAIELASLWYEAAEDSQLRQRIATAIVTLADDPFDAASFITRHGDELRNDPATLMMMGRRADSAPALSAEYEMLLANDADSRARGTLVRAMESTDPDSLLSIVDREPDLEVRCAALAMATFVADGVPDVRALVRLQELSGLSTSMTALDLVTVARRLGDGFRRSAQGAEAAAAATVLIDLARNPTTPRSARREALEALRVHLPEEALAELKAELGS